MKKDKILIIFIAFFIVVGIAAAIIGNKPEEDESSQADTDTEAEAQTEMTTQFSLEDFTIAESDVEVNDELTAHILELGDACDSYYVNELKNNGRKIVSLYSFLYDYSEKAEITADTLKDGGYYNYPSDLSGVSLHYFVPSKVQKYIPEYEDTMKLKIFCAMPVKGGILLHSTGHDDSIISAEDYRQLMFDHVVSSEPVNPKIGSSEYDAIKTDVLDNIEGNYEIKHLACNDKYAILVTGSLDDVSDIKEYLIIKKDGKWTVEDDGLAEEASAAMFLNENYFDCDLSLLPVYNIRDYGEIKTDLSKFISTFATQGYISADDKAVYQCGAFNCAYFEFESGAKIVGVVEDEQFKVEKVDNAEQAIVYMVEKCADMPAPIYVIKMGDYMITQK